MVTGSGEIAAISEVVAPWLRVGSVSRPLPPLGADIARGPYQFLAYPRVRPPEARPDTPRGFRAMLLGRVEDALDALAAAGWQLCGYPEMKFAGHVEPFVQTIGGILVIPAVQWGHLLEVNVKVDRPR